MKSLFYHAIGLCHHRVLKMTQIWEWIRFFTIRARSSFIEHEKINKNIHDFSYRLLSLWKTGNRRNGIYYKRDIRVLKRPIIDELQLASNATYHSNRKTATFVHLLIKVARSFSWMPTESQYLVFIKPESIRFSRKYMILIPSGLKNAHFSTISNYFNDVT